jgi:hypothetical protein
MDLYLRNCYPLPCMGQVHMVQVHGRVQASEPSIMTGVISPSLHRGSPQTPAVELVGGKDTISPIAIDSKTMEKGKELHKVIRMFKQATTSPLSSFLLEIANNKS